MTDVAGRDAGAEDAGFDADGGDVGEMTEGDGEGTRPLEPGNLESCAPILAKVFSKIPAPLDP